MKRILVKTSLPSGSLFTYSFAIDREIVLVVINGKSDLGENMSVYPLPLTIEGHSGAHEQTEPNIGAIQITLSHLIVLRGALLGLCSKQEQQYYEYH